MPTTETGALPQIDPVVHGPLRLAILSLLAGADTADFKWLRAKTGSTDGNLGANLTRLEQAGYIAVSKKFLARKPNSLYRLTPAGRKALASYIAALKKLLGEAL